MQPLWRSFSRDRNLLTIITIRRLIPRSMTWHAHFMSIVGWRAPGLISSVVASSFGAGMLPGGEDSGSGVAGYEPPCVDRTLRACSGQVVPAAPHSKSSQSRRRPAPLLGSNRVVRGVLVTVSSALARFPAGLPDSTFGFSVLFAIFGATAIVSTVEQE